MIQLILIFLGVSVIGFFALAVGLILSQRPLAVLAGMPEDEFQAAATATSDIAPVAVSKARLRDGLEIDVRQLSANGIDPPLLILLHGSGWYVTGMASSLTRCCPRLPSMPMLSRQICAGTALRRNSGVMLPISGSLRTISRTLSIFMRALNKKLFWPDTVPVVGW